MRVATLGALVTGLAVAIILVAWQGADAVAAAMAALGAGIVLLPAVYVPHLLGAAASWSVLFAPGLRPRFTVALRAVWIGISVETLLPAASLGAELVKARLLTRAGTRVGDAAAAVVADVTVQALVLAFWGLAGVGALLSTQAGSALVYPALAGAAALTAGIGGLLLVQRAGLFEALAKAGGRAIRARQWPAVIGAAARLDATLRALYRRPQRIALACAIRGLSRALLAVELWLVAVLIGHPVAPLDAIMLMGIVGALRAATVVIPGGWGVQEGGFVLLGGLVDLPAEIMLALSLATRARELMVSLPALAVWQAAEGRSLRTLVRRRREEPHSWTQPSH